MAGHLRFDDFDSDSQLNLEDRVHSNGKVDFDSGDENEQLEDMGDANSLSPEDDDISFENTNTQSGPQNGGRKKKPINVHPANQIFFDHFEAKRRTATVEEQRSLAAILRTLKKFYFPILSGVQAQWLVGIGKKYSGEFDAVLRRNGREIRNNTGTTPKLGEWASSSSSTSSGNQYQADPTELNRFRKHLHTRENKILKSKGLVPYVSEAEQISYALRADLLGGSDAEEAGIHCKLYTLCLLTIIICEHLNG